MHQMANATSANQIQKKALFRNPLQNYYSKLTKNVCLQKKYKIFAKKMIFVLIEGH